MASTRLQRIEKEIAELKQQFLDNERYVAIKETAGDHILKFLNQEIETFRNNMATLSLLPGDIAQGTTFNRWQAVHDWLIGLREKICNSEETRSIVTRKQDELLAQAEKIRQQHDDYSVLE